MKARPILVAILRRELEEMDREGINADMHRRVELKIPAGMNISPTELAQAAKEAC